MEVRYRCPFLKQVMTQIAVLIMSRFHYFLIGASALLILVNIDLFTNGTFDMGTNVITALLMAVLVFVVMSMMICVCVFMIVLIQYVCDGCFQGDIICVIDEKGIHENYNGQVIDIAWDKIKYIRKKERAMMIVTYQGRIRWYISCRLVDPVTFFKYAKDD